ncbi:MAG: histidinol-phosphate transaminase [Oscillospiraceae bacterium]|nr:histidinol-phosphate transaminase [Oscillospiraceae bacterium]
MEFLWEGNVRKANPYTPGEQPNGQGVIKLNTNENPYPPPELVAEVLMDYNRDSARLYPDTNSTALTEALAKRYGVDASQIFIGVGSDDVISMLFMTFFNSSKPVLFPDITYSFYEVWADIYKVPFKTLPLDENFRMNPADYKIENGGIIFPNPNAPTGVYEPLELVEEIAAANPGAVVIVDEAYVDFGGVSCLPLIEKYDNLIIVQTFSKSRSMAGMRIGFAVGNKRLIKFLNDVKFSVNSYTMNHISQLCGAASVKCDVYFKNTLEKIINTRENTKRRLAELGFSFPDSKANFIFARHDVKNAGEIFNALKARKIYVRHWNKPRISDYLRITIGTDGEMDTLIEALKGIINHEQNF